MNFPDELGVTGTPFASFIRHNAQRGEYGPGDPEEQVAARVRMAANPSPHRFERIRPDTGMVLDIIGTPAEAGGFVTTYADITDIRHQERLLREKQAHFELALTSANLGVWEWDLRTDTFTADQRFGNLTGLADTNPFSRSALMAILDPKDRDLLRDITIAHAKGETPNFEAPIRIHHFSKGWRWLLLHGTVVERGPDDEAIRMMGTAMDETTRKTDEILLIERERRLVALMKSMQDIIIMLDTGGAITELWMPPNFEFPLNRPSNALVGSEFTDALPDEMHEGISNGLVQAMIDGTTQRFQFRLKSNTKTYQATLNPLADQSKYASGFVLAIRDMTEVL